MTTLKYGPYSYSRINVGTCPYAFSKQYIDRSKVEVEWENLMFGGIVHEILEHRLQMRLGKEPAMEHDALINKYAPPKILHRYAEMRDILEKFAVDFYIPETAGWETFVEMAWAIDNRLQMCDWNDPTCIMRGKGDVVSYYHNPDVAVTDSDGDIVRIVDHKTSFLVRSMADLETDFQLALYAWLASIRFPNAKTFIIGINFCRYPFTRFVTKTRESLDLVKDEFKARVNAIENTTDWSTGRPGPFCSICGYTASCPVMQAMEMRGKVIIKNKETAVKAAQEYRVIDQHAKDLRKAIEGYAGSHGAINIGEFEYGYKMSEGYSYPFMKTLEILEKHGVDYSNMASFNSKDIKKLLKTKNKDLIDELMDVRMDNSKFSFRGAKP